MSLLDWVPFYPAWHNRPTKTTPITAAALQHYDDFLGEVADAVNSQVPAGSIGYTIETEDFFGQTVNVYVAPVAAGDNGVVWAAKIPGDAFARWMFAVDSEGGLYLTDGTKSAADGGWNLFFWDYDGSGNGIAAISGQTRFANGGILLFGAPIVWEPTGQREIGDPSVAGTTPSMIGVKSYATASRPAVPTSGEAFMIFDSDLGKPVWSHGGGWVDATGTTV